MHPAPTATQPPLPRQRHQRQPGQRRDREAQERRVAHRRGRGQPRPDQPHRPDPVVVGAADAVGVVVGVVDAHDERDGDDQREQRPQRLTAAAPTAAPRCRPAPGRPRSAASAAARPRPTRRHSPPAQVIEDRPQGGRATGGAAPPTPAGTARSRPAASSRSRTAGGRRPGRRPGRRRAPSRPARCAGPPGRRPDRAERAVARPQVVDGDPGVVLEPERVPEHAVGEVDPGRVEHGPPELVLAAVVAVLLRGLRLRQPAGQVPPLLTLRRTRSSSRRGCSTGRRPRPARTRSGRWGRTPSRRSRCCRAAPGPAARAGRRTGPAR